MLATHGIASSSLDIFSCLLQEEGIIIKALDSEWRLNDRSTAWLKIKPDYVHQNEIDAVIIGGYRGGGRHGGTVAEYLLALAEAPRGGAKNPSKFISFCRYLAVRKT